MRSQEAAGDQPWERGRAHVRRETSSPPARAGAADAAPGRVSGAPLVVAALVAELAVAEVAGAVGAAAGATDDVTVAVIE